MKIGGKGLGEPIGERFDDDRAVIVVGPLERADQFVGAKTGRHRERADVIGDGGRPIRHEIG